MIGIDARKKKLLIAGAIAWYFIAYNGGVAQIGPFATQAACSNYAASIQVTGNLLTTTCFGTTAKQ
jgi:hypothetical protein